jgi:selenocysteine-specific elongation factor
VAVSPVTGAGLDELRTALGDLVAGLPEPDTDAPVRLWIDRAFTIKGAGTVVTGTLGAGRLRAGDELELTGAHRPVRIRGLQSLGRPPARSPAVARVAVNLRGVDKNAITRGAALLTPGRFRETDLIDVRVHGDPVAHLPATVTLHTGSAAVPVRVRPLGADTARLRLTRPLPLRIGDRALLRDPGRHHVAGGVTVLDVAPPALSRRGAAAARAGELATMDGVPDAAGELRRRLLVRRTDLARMGVPAAGSAVAGEWLADPAHWAGLRERLAAEVGEYAREHPLEPGAPVESLRQRLGPARPRAGGRAGAAAARDARRPRLRGHSGRTRRVGHRGGQCVCRSDRPAVRGAGGVPARGARPGSPATGGGGPRRAGHPGRGERRPAR